MKQYFFYYQTFLSDGTNAIFSDVSDSQRRNKEDVKKDSSTQKEQNNGKNLNYCWVCVTNLKLARVASISVGFGNKERDFWCFARAENGERAKNRSIFALQFLAPQPHRNACYADYQLIEVWK